MTYADTNTDKPAGCGGRCAQCNLIPDVPGGLRGWRLVLPAAGMFLAPLALALAGAVLAGRDGTRQAAGAAAGLLAGAIIAIVVGRIVARRSRCGQEPAAGEPAGKERS